ncbi:hypothetical protein GGR25_001747 [Kaistia hirudinis]|uniref:DUF1491 family protein n=1 Tax=Kaistia hirudinis TaxID=1293440 RepID=A0A840AN13_9HYPH|nr:DUF1491 family protein [Kaistia hirudinis]MBB3930708.1 hypothetical protein [Kaistia hirudinis]
MSLRVTSALWVSAYVRRVFVQGGFAATMRRGAEEAGAIFVIVDRLNGTVDLYGPAPQTAFDDDRPRDRLFIRMEHAAERPVALARFDKEMRFDPDLWLVEVEDREGRAFLETIDPDKL